MLLDWGCLGCSGCVSALFIPFHCRVVSALLPIPQVGREDARAGSSGRAAASLRYGSRELPVTGP